MRHCHVSQQIKTFVNLPEVGAPEFDATHEMIRKAEAHKPRYANPAQVTTAAHAIQQYTDNRKVTFCSIDEDREISRDAVMESWKEDPNTTDSLVQLALNTPSASAFFIEVSIESLAIDAIWQAVMDFGADLTEIN